MHLLYLDDAGSVGNRNERHFVIAGIAMFECQAHWFSWIWNGCPKLGLTGWAAPAPTAWSFTATPYAKATAGGANWSGQNGAKS